MPNTTIERYDALRSMGHSPQESAELLGMNSQEAGVAGAAGSYGLDEATIAAISMASNDVYTPEQLAYASASASTRLSFDDMFPEGVHTKRDPWWRGVVNAAITIGDTLATPQQLMWQGLADAGGEGDWRKAIPDWAAPDDWKKQGVDHELIMIGDVLDEYIGGKYHALLQDLDKQGGIAKYGGGWGLKTVEFLADIATDPMNIIAGAGIGKKLTKELRRTLPKAVQVEHGLKAAAKSRSLVDYMDVRKILAEHIDDLEAEAMGVPSKEVGKKLALARTAADQIDDEIDYLSKVDRFGNDVELPPVNRTQAMNKPGPDATDAEKIAWAVQKETDDAVSQPLRFEDLDNETLFKRMVFGPDDPEMLSAAILRVMKGEDTGGLLVRGLLDNVFPTTTSLEIAISGIGKNGMITKEMAGSLKVFDEVAALRKGRLGEVVRLKTQLRDAAKAAVDAAKPRALADEIAAGESLVSDIRSKIVAVKDEILDNLTNPAGKDAALHAAKKAELNKLRADLSEAKRMLTEAKSPGARAVNEEAKKAAEEAVAAIEKDLAAAKTGAKATSAEIRHFKKYGVFSPAATDNLGIKAPSGPRRDIFSAADFVDNTRFGMRISTAILYPGSVMPNANWVLGNRMFREPMRVLEQNLPGAWEVVRGGQRAKEAFVKGTSGKLKRIYEEAGVIEASELPKGAKMLVGTEASLKTRVNKERDELLYKLLDTDPADGEYATLLAQADEKLIKARDELRAVFNQIATRLGAAEDKLISYYMPHVIKDSWFDAGRMPPEFVGTRKINGVPWFLKDRVGSEFHITSATETLDIYTRGVAKYLYTDPSLDMLQKMANNAGRLNPKMQWLSGYASDIAANVRGEPSALSGMLGKMGFGDLEDGARKAAAALGSLTYSAALAGNIRYPIMSIVQAINTTAAEFGMLRTLKGMARQMTAEGKLISKAAGVAEQHVAHFEDLQGSWARVMSEVRVASPMSISDTENMIRGLTFHTSLDETLTKYGYKSLNDVADAGHFREIIAKAVRDSEDINHVFGTFGKPVAFGRFSRTGSALATQFMSFPVKQTETIVSNSLKNPGFLVDYLIIAGQMQSVIGRANLNVAPFLGFGYGDVVTRDVSSLPIDVMGSAVKAFTAVFDYDMPVSEKERLYDDFKRNAAMLIPGQRAYQNTKGTLTELATGEKRNKRTGALERNLNLSVAGNDKIYGQGAEWLSVLTRVESKQGKMKADADRVQRLNRAQRSSSARAIVKEVNKVYREGKPLDMKKVHALEVDLSRLGVPIGTTNLVKILQSEEQSHVLIERLRDNPAEFGDEFRLLDDHKFYQGAR